MQTIQSIIGIFGLLAIALAFSENHRAVSFRQAAVGLVLTIVLAALFLWIPQLKVAFKVVSDAVDAIATATGAGTSFVFGYLGGGPLPFALTAPEAGREYIFALRALPVVLVMSVLTTLLFHWRILQPIVSGFGFVLERTLGVGGAVGLSTAANVFLGMVEAPLCIKPYLNRLTRSELFVVMTGGMAGIAGTVLVLYAQVLGKVIPDAAGHMVVASVLGAPAAILISLIMVPETPGGEPSMVEKIAPVANSTMDAVVRGTAAGLELLLNICAMLIVLIALVHLVNGGLGQLVAFVTGALGLSPDVGGAPVTLERLLGIVMAPVCWLMGVPWSEAAKAGELMGLKTILNEFVAYIKMAALSPDALSERSKLIMLYALCGFANFGSLGIMIGGLATMAPERRDDVVSLGFKSIVSGTLSTCLIGAIVGALV
jgi:CNT family concentrative nucleoside transporter